MFERGHQLKDCYTRKQCSEKNCNRYHHPSLHEAHKHEQTFHYTKHENHSYESTCLLQLMKIESDSTLSVNVLWEGGATVSLTTFDMANQLQLKG